MDESLLFFGGHFEVKFEVFILLKFIFKNNNEKCFDY